MSLAQARAKAAEDETLVEELAKCEWELTDMKWAITWVIFYEYILILANMIGITPWAYYSMLCCLLLQCTGKGEFNYPGHPRPERVNCHWANCAPCGTFKSFSARFWEQVSHVLIQMIDEFLASVSINMDRNHYHFLYNAARIKAIIQEILKHGGSGCIFWQDATVQMDTLQKGSENDLASIIMQTGDDTIDALTYSGKQHNTEEVVNNRSCVYLQGVAASLVRIINLSHLGSLRRGIYGWTQGIDFSKQDVYKIKVPEKKAKSQMEKLASKLAQMRANGQTADDLLRDEERPQRQVNTEDSKKPPLRDLRWFRESEKLKDYDVGVMVTAKMLFCVFRESHCMWEPSDPERKQKPKESTGETYSTLPSIVENYKRACEAAGEEVVYPPNILDEEGKVAEDCYTGSDIFIRAQEYKIKMQDKLKAGARTILNSFHRLVHTCGLGNHFITLSYHGIGFDWRHGGFQLTGDTSMVDYTCMRYGMYCAEAYVCDMNQFITVLDNLALNTPKGAKLIKFKYTEAQSQSMVHKFVGKILLVTTCYFTPTEVNQTYKARHIRGVPSPIEGVRAAMKFLASKGMLRLKYSKPRSKKDKNKVVKGAWKKASADWPVDNYSVCESILTQGGSSMSEWDDSVGNIENNPEEDDKDASNPNNNDNSSDNNNGNVVNNTGNNSIDSINNNSINNNINNNNNSSNNINNNNMNTTVENSINNPINNNINNNNINYNINNNINTNNNNNYINDSSNDSMNNLNNNISNIDLSRQPRAARIPGRPELPPRAPPRHNNNNNTSNNNNNNNMYHMRRYRNLNRYNSNNNINHNINNTIINTNNSSDNTSHQHPTTPLSLQRSPRMLGSAERLRQMGRKIRRSSNTSMQSNKSNKSTDVTMFNDESGSDSGSDRETDNDGVSSDKDDSFDSESDDNFVRKKGTIGRDTDNEEKNIQINDPYYRTMNRRANLTNLRFDLTQSSNNNDNSGSRWVGTGSSQYGANDHPYYKGPSGSITNINEHSASNRGGSGSTLTYSPNSMNESNSIINSNQFEYPAFPDISNNSDILSNNYSNNSNNNSNNNITFNSNIMDNNTNNSNESSETALIKVKKHENKETNMRNDVFKGNKGLNELYGPNARAQHTYNEKEIQKRRDRVNKDARIVPGVTYKGGKTKASSKASRERAAAPEGIGARVRQRRQGSVLTETDRINKRNTATRAFENKLRNKMNDFEKYEEEQRKKEKEKLARLEKRMANAKNNKNKKAGRRTKNRTNMRV